MLFYFQKINKGIIISISSKKNLFLKVSKFKKSQKISLFLD